MGVGIAEPKPMTNTVYPASANALAATTDSLLRWYCVLWNSVPSPPQANVSIPSVTRTTNFCRHSLAESPALFAFRYNLASFNDATSIVPPEADSVLMLPDPEESTAQLLEELQ